MDAVVLDLSPNIQPRLVELLEVGAYLIGCPSFRGQSASLANRGHGGVGIEQANQPLYVSRVVSGHEGPSDLDFLLRHRPRSIPRREGGCRRRTARSGDRRVARCEKNWK